MDIAVLLGIFILLWEVGVFVLRMFLKAVCYIIAVVIALVIYAVSFLLNVFTVPLLIIVHIAQKRRGGQLPCVGRRLLVFYPTFTDPRITEAHQIAFYERNCYVCAEHDGKQLQKIADETSIYLKSM